jgi:NADH-quinone oxidoreductase subunit J
MTDLLTPLHILFYLFSAVAVGSAFNVVLARNPVRSVLSLVITFFAMAGTWMLLRAEFLSLILIVVYVGAVMTLFLFVIMMLSVDRESRKGGFVRYLPVGIIIALLLVGMLVVAVGPSSFGLTQMPAPPTEPADYSNTAQIGMLLFTNYVYPFEIAGVLLLAAMIAAITLANRGPLKRKVQNPMDQMAVRPEDRVRLINMPSEPKPSLKTGE